MTLHISVEMLILINLGKITLKAWANYMHTLIMAALCNRGAIMFLPCSFFLSSSIFFLFLPRLISASADWMSTILPHMVWP